MHFAKGVPIPKLATMKAHYFVTPSTQNKTTIFLFQCENLLRFYGHVLKQEEEHHASRKNRMILHKSLTNQLFKP